MSYFHKQHTFESMSTLRVGLAWLSLVSISEGARGMNEDLSSTRCH